MKIAPVRRIIPNSLVDGPGNRTAIFLQGCNLRCDYCHNPETQKIYSYESSDANSQIRWMTAEEVFNEIDKDIPFIRGITLSGGECTLYPQFIKELFILGKKAGLSCLIDSNGTIDFSLYPDLMEVCDGVMLDVKAWDKNKFKVLRGIGFNTADPLAASAKMNPELSYAIVDHEYGDDILPNVICAVFDVEEASMNILYGLYRANEGEIYLSGKKVDIRNPNVAIEHGIGMVHQHFMLVDNFTIAQNIILGVEDTKGFGVIDYNKSIKKIYDIIEKYGLEVEPNELIENVSVGMQLMKIGKKLD